MNPTSAAAVATNPNSCMFNSANSSSNEEANDRGESNNSLPADKSMPKDIQSLDYANETDENGGGGGYGSTRPAANSG